jgi:hypothetical protein
VQIDAAVELVSLLVETHHGSPWAWARVLEPASWLEGASFLKIPRWAEASASSPYTLGTSTQPIPTEAMKIIQRMKLTGAAILVSRPSLDFW